MGDRLKEVLNGHYDSFTTFMTITYRLFIVAAILGGASFALDTAGRLASIESTLNQVQARMDRQDRRLDWIERRRNM